MMMKKAEKLFYLFVFVLSAFFLTQCSDSLQVKTNYDESVDFSQYKTFDFYQIKEENGSLGELTWRRILMAIEQELGKKGIKKSNDPDLLINLYALSNIRQETTVNNNGVTYFGGMYGGYYMPYGAGFGISYSPNVTTSTTAYREGTFVVDVIDRHKKQLVLQGIVNSSAEVNPRDSDRRINYAVRKIFAKIPEKK